MFCPNCGNHILDANASFCPNCGAQLNSFTQGNDQSSAQQDSQQNSQQDFQQGSQQNSQQDFQQDSQQNSQQNSQQDSQQSWYNQFNYTPPQQDCTPCAPSANYNGLSIAGFCVSCAAIFFKAPPRKGKRVEKEAQLWYNRGMNKQISMSFLHDELKEVSTHKKEFLERIERIMPWDELEKLVRPYYYEGKYGNKPYDLELMLRIHLLQNLYDLSDMGARNEVIDSRAFSDFCGVESSNQIPDGDTIGKFRNLLIRNDIHEKFFSMVVKNLTDRGLILKKGTIVDSTIISAPSSTKNKEKKRDPDAHSVKKGNAWHFGYKAHIGVDKDSGLVHHVEVTPANVHDVEMTPKLLTGDESEVYGDSGYIGAEKRQDAIIRNKQGKRIRYKQNRRPSQIKKLSASGQRKAKQAEHEKSSVRAKVEHVFAVIKGQFRYRKTRYRGLRKQTAKLNMLFALANLVLADRRCPAV